MWHCDNHQMWHCDNPQMWHCDNPQNITCHTYTPRCPTLQGDLGPWQPCDVSHSSTPILIQSTPSSSPSLSLCEHSAAYPIVAAKTSFQNPITAIGFLRIAANTNSQQTACTQNFRKTLLKKLQKNTLLTAQNIGNWISQECQPNTNS